MRYFFLIAFGMFVANANSLAMSLVAKLVPVVVSVVDSEAKVPIRDAVVSVTDHSLSQWIQFEVDPIKKRLYADANAARRTNELGDALIYCAFEGRIPLDGGSPTSSIHAAIHVTAEGYLPTDLIIDSSKDAKIYSDGSASRITVKLKSVKIPSASRSSTTTNAEQSPLPTGFSTTNSNQQRSSRAGGRARRADES